MSKKELNLSLHGKSIELCIGRIHAEQKRKIDAFCLKNNILPEVAWYEDKKTMHSILAVDNWWSVNQLDHAVGLLFTDKDEIKTALKSLEIAFDGTNSKSDTAQLHMEFYLPEKINAPDNNEIVVSHGAVRNGHLRLKAESEHGFDPSMIRFSFLHYKDYGYILIDMEYDGFDDIEYSFTDESFLAPTFTG